MPILPKSKKRKLVLTLIVYLYFSLSRYDFKNPGFKSGTGHFTQVVWQQTAEIGIGQAKSDDGKIFVVARYRPAGNFINNFQDNVKPKVRQGNVRDTKVLKLFSPVVCFPSCGVHFN